MAKKQPGKLADRLDILREEERELLRTYFEYQLRKELEEDRKVQQQEKQGKNPYGTNIKRNMVECRLCGDVIESTHRHDFRRCKCGAIAVDGGKAYLKRSAKSFDDLIERSEYVEPVPEEA